MKILVLSPHPDDVELAMGAYLMRLAKADHKMITWIGSYCGIRLEFDEALDEIWDKATYIIRPDDNTEMLRNFDKYRAGLLQWFYKYSNEIKPDIVFMPTLTDCHQDHQVVAQEAFRAFKKTTLISYIHPHNEQAIQPNYFVPISKKELEAKIKLTQIYKSQAHRHYMKPDFIRATARFYGTMIGVRYAEAFHVIRQIVN